MKCDALFKGTSVDGVYDADPKKDPTARRYATVTFSKVLSDDLKVMDASAIALCRDNDIPIVVFNIRDHGNLAAVLAGGGASRRSCRTRRRCMPAYDKADLERRMAGAVEALKHDLGRSAHGSRIDRAARSGDGRGLWQHDAAEPGRDRFGARAADAVRASVGQGQCRPPSKRRSGRRGWG